jgi:hypothetical protein
MTKRPVVYLAVILPLLSVGGVASIAGMLAIYSKITGTPPANIPNRNGLLIGLPAFFLWIPLSLFLSNCVLFVVAPLRRVAERFVAEAHRPGFFESQRQLLVLSAAFAVICVPLIALGFWL